MTRRLLYDVAAIVVLIGAVAIALLLPARRCAIANLSPSGRGGFGFCTGVPTWPRVVIVLGGIALCLVIVAVGRWERAQRFFNRI